MKSELFNGIEENFEKYNENNSKEYKISISVGMVECYGENTLKEYINLADIEMYKDKKKRKKIA